LVKFPKLSQSSLKELAVLPKQSITTKAYISYGRHVANAQQDMHYNMKQGVGKGR